MKVIRYSVAPIHPKWDVYALLCSVYILVGAKLASPTRYLHNEFSGYFLGFKREINFASSLSIRIVESSLSNVWQRKDLAKLAEKNERVKTFFSDDFKSKKIEP